MGSITGNRLTHPYKMVIQCQLYTCHCNSSLTVNCYCIWARVDANITCITPSLGNIPMCGKNEACSNEYMNIGLVLSYNVISDHIWMSLILYGNMTLMCQQLTALAMTG